NDTSELPKYLCLFGDASYDYKDRIASNTNFVPTYETDESKLFENGFSFDDFYSFLDDHENINRTDIANTMDAGVGRIPVQNLDEGLQGVDKIIHYKRPQSLGPWRLRATFIGDSYDSAGNHVGDADSVSKIVNNQSPVYTANTIYLDNLPFITTPSGDRCPDGNKMLNDQISKGTFLVNYSGHGNPSALAHERIVTQDDFTKWNNLDKLPFMVTATCDFAIFDKPEQRSAGERIVMKSDGGAIAMLTTTQAVYAYANLVLNTKFIKTQFSHNGNDYLSYGDAFRISKNEEYSKVPTPLLLNYRKFTLLGDPALTPNFPRYTVETDSMKDVSSQPGFLSDTLKALGKYEVYGSVIGDDQLVKSDFNGLVDITIYDKPKHYDIPTKNSGYPNQVFETQV